MRIVSEFQSVFESALVTILILDDQAVFREANPAAEELFGVRRKELIGESLDPFCQDSSEFQQNWQLLLVQKELGSGPVQVHLGSATAFVLLYCQPHPQQRQPIKV